MVEQGAGYCTNHQFVARKGSSAVKRIKTRLRKRLKNDMLNSLLHVSINGPAVSTPEAKEVVNTAVANWLQKKNRRLQRPPISTKKRHHLSSYPETCFGWPRHPVLFSCGPIECRTIETCWRTTTKRSVLGKEGLLLAWKGLGFRKW